MAPKLNLKEIEVECVRPYYPGNEPENITLMLTVVRGPRGRRKLLGEAFARQVYHPIIHFKVYEDESVEVLFSRFLQQLVHRGYRPLRYREMSIEERWGSWADCDLTTVDTSSLERAADSDMDIGEERSAAAEYPPKSNRSPK